MRLSTEEACEILGIPENATRNEINEAYKKRARQYHPDHAEFYIPEKWLRIFDAYTSLTTPEQKDDASIPAIEYHLNEALLLGVMKALVRVVEIFTEQYSDRELSSEEIKTVKTVVAQLLAQQPEPKDAPLASKPVTYDSSRSISSSLYRDYLRYGFVCTQKEHCQEIVKKPAYLSDCIVMKIAQKPPTATEFLKTVCGL
jgi:hypothetical protein